MSMQMRMIAAGLAATTCLTGLATPAFAQDAGVSAPGEIVVTARKREETALQVPVSVTAIGQEQLKNFAINSVDSMARAVPGLIIGEGSGTIQGGIIAIRGLAGADANPLNDQAVSFNIDGVGVGRATIRRMGDFDTAQIEVLKGPQALFFGKNSPAGIIVMKSADPTQDFEAKLSSGYEFKGKEWRTDAYVSGPLSDSLGFRVAGFYTNLKGWSHNIVSSQEDAAYPFISSPGNRSPKKKEFALRGTLKFDDGGPFNAKVKLSYGKTKGDSSTANTQFVACPLGQPQNSLLIPDGFYIDDCKADSTNQVGAVNTDALTTLFPSKKGWDKGLHQDQYQFLGGLEMNFDLSDKLTLSSQTGYYRQKLNNIGNYTQSYFNSGGASFINSEGDPVSPGTGATVLYQDLPSWNQLALKEFSQELRLTSKMDGPFNFMVGGLLTSTDGAGGSTTARNTWVAATFVNRYLYKQKGKSQSVFGQVIVNPVEVIEISAGARASWEQKHLTYLGNGSFAPTGGVPVTYWNDPAYPNQMNDIRSLVPGFKPKRKYHDVSPEFTVAFKPNQDLNIYAGYKEGFISGGFSALNPTGGHMAGTNPFDYDQQTTRGFEAGIKAALFDRTLRLNLAAYNYKTKGLQVTVTTAGVQQVQTNAGSVRTKGIEFDMSWRTPLQGLSLTGAVNYNKATYLEYLSACYRGQESETCVLQPDGVTRLQDLAGQRLVRAPRWTGNAGFNYNTPIGSSMKLGLSGLMAYSGGYFSDVTNTPGGWQKSYTLFDASARLGAADDSWEIALIGKNLTNKYYFVRSSDTPFTGSSPGAYAKNDPLRILGDTAAYPSRGRELWVRLSYKFGAK